MHILGRRHTCLRTYVLPQILLFSLFFSFFRRVLSELAERNSTNTNAHVVLVNLDANWLLIVWWSTAGRSHFFTINFSASRDRIGVGSNRDRTKVCQTDRLGSFGTGVITDRFQCSGTTPAQREQLKCRLEYQLIHMSIAKNPTWYSIQSRCSRLSLIHIWRCRRRG